MRKARFLGIDTETTGPDPWKDRLVTVAMVARREDGSEAHCHLLADAGGAEVLPAAAAVHGYSTEYVRANGQPVTEVLAEVLRWLFHAQRERVPIVAFNAPFDLTLLRREAGIAGLDFPSDLVVADPLVLDWALDPQRHGRRRLVDVADHYGVTLAAAHDALADTRATLDVLEALERGFPGLPGDEGYEALQGPQSVWSQRFNATYQERRRRKDPRFTMDQGWPFLDPRG